MATIYAVSGLPTKNNTGSVLHAGNVTRDNMSSITLAENAAGHPRPDVVLSSTVDIGTQKAISGGIFAYSPQSDEFVATTLTGKINGSANTLLRSGASDVGTKRTGKGVPHERYDNTSWDAATGQLTKGGNAGVNVLQSGVDGVTGVFSDNSYNNFEFTHSGPNVVPKQNNFDSIRQIVVSRIGIPGAPISLTATSVSSSGIDLAWLAPSDDGGTDINYYRIQRESPTGSGFSTIYNAAGLTYSETLLTSGEYNYRVYAVNEIGAGPASNEDSANTYYV